MKLLLTLTAISACHAAAKLAAGDICQSNLECSRDCLLGEWTLGYQDDGYVFECDQRVEDLPRFYRARCMTTDVRPEGGRYSAGDGAGTKSACAAVGGTVCSIFCHFWAGVCRGEHAFRLEGGVSG